MAWMEREVAFKAKALDASNEKKKQIVFEAQ